MDAQFLVLSPELSAPELVKKCVEALGGEEAFAKVESIRMTGRMRLGEGALTPFSVLAKRPNFYRIELTAGPDRVVQAFDGTVGWQSVSGQHEQAPTALSGESLSRLMDQAANAIGGPLVEMEKRGNKVELAGRESAGEVDCIRLQVTLATGDSMLLLIDPTTFREVQEEIPIKINGQSSAILQTAGNYRRFGSIWIPCLRITRQKGSQDSQRTEIDSVDLNPQLDNELFRFAANPTK